MYTICRPPLLGSSQLLTDIGRIRTSRVCFYGSFGLVGGTLDVRRNRDVTFRRVVAGLEDYVIGTSSFQFVNAWVDELDVYCQEVESDSAI